MMTWDLVYSTKLNRFEISKQFILSNHFLRPIFLQFLLVYTRKDFTSAVNEAIHLTHKSLIVSPLLRCHQFHVFV